MVASRDTPSINLDTMIDFYELSDSAKIGIIVAAIAVVVIVALIISCVSYALYRKYSPREVENPNYVKFDYVQRRQQQEKTHIAYGDVYGSFGQVMPTLSETKERRASTTMYDSKESVLSEQLEEMQFLPPLDTTCEPCDLGTLELSLRYHEVTGLIITVHQVLNLPSKMYGGSTEPFVSFVLTTTSENEPTFKFQTTTKHKVLNPIFEESFNAKIDYPDLMLYNFTFCVCEHHKFNKSSVIGAARLDLAEVDFTEPYKASLQLEPSEKNYFGEMLISLCYLSTSNRLIIGILRATNLKPVSGSSQSHNMCVRVTLILGGRKLKRRRTQVQDNNQNPEFDELMYFEVPQEKLDKVKFLVVVTNSKKHEEQTDDALAAEELGRVLIGRKCSALSYAHWNEMMRYPRRPFAQWYNLVE